MPATGAAHGNLCVSIKKYAYVFDRYRNDGPAPAKAVPGAGKHDASATVC